MGRVEETTYFHGESEVDFGFFDGAGDGGGVGSIGCAGERDVAFACEQTGGWVEADPTGAGQKHFGPGVEISGIGFVLFGGELNKIAGDETGGKAELAQHLDKKPTGIATGAAAFFESFFGGLDAFFRRVS